MLALATLLMVPAVAACRGGGAERATPLRVAVPQWPGYEALHLAEAEGLYAERGVDVEIVDMASLVDAHRAFERGQADGAALTLAEMVALEPEERDYRMVLLLDTSNGADVIIGAPGYTGIEDLAGGTIGAEWAPLGTQMVGRALQEHGLEVDDTSLKRASPEELPALLRDGSVDAIQTYPPYSVGLVEEGYPVLFTSAEIPGEIVDVVAFGAGVIEERRTDVERFVAAWSDALDYVDREPVAAMEVMAEREGVSPAAFATSWRGATFLTLADQLAAMHDGSTERACRRFGVLATEVGLVDGSAPACRVDASILEAVAG